MRLKGNLVTCWRDSMKTNTDKRIQVILFVLGATLFTSSSCSSLKRMNYYDESKQFYRDVLSSDGGFCARRIRNDYWIKAIEEGRRDAMHKYLDSIGGAKTADDYRNFERTQKHVTIQAASPQENFVIDYERVLADMERSNDKKFSRLVDCKSPVGYISLPLFNAEHSVAVVEVPSGTFIFERDAAGHWVFKERGEFRVF